MRAIICEEFASPETLKISEVAQPEPKGNEVLVRVESAGLGYVDALTVAGRYQIKPKLPFIPGNELSGVVEKTGTDVRHLRPGQRILASSSGGLAEFTLVEEERCTPIPDSLSHEAAAGFLVNYCTAYHGFNYCGKLQEKETVLILGASGGVGIAAIDVAKAMGARVIAAASTEAKRDACLKAGANQVLDYSRDNWRDELRQILDGTPLNLVYDPVGGDFAEPALRSLGADGRYLVVGFAGGDIPRFPINLMLLKRCSVIGVNWGGHIAENPYISKEVLTTLLEWVVEEKISPSSSDTFGLDDAGEAMMKMLNRQAIGKIVIHPHE